MTDGFLNRALRQTGKPTKLGRPFDQWRRTLMKLARDKKKIYLLPGQNELLRLFESGLTTEKVFIHYCD